MLNDVSGLRTDVGLRPQRSLLSGRVAPGVARWLGWELLILGMATAWLAGWLEGSYRPGVVAALLAASIVLYDAWLKRTPLGPLAMGGCRMLNVLLGMSVSQATGALVGQALGLKLLIGEIVFHFLNLFPGSPCLLLFLERHDARVVRRAARPARPAEPSGHTDPYTPAR